MIEALVNEWSDGEAQSASLIAAPTFVPPSSPPSVQPFEVDGDLPSPPPQLFDAVVISSPTFLPSAPVPEMTDRPTLQSLIINAPGSSTYDPSLPDTRAPGWSISPLLAIAAVVALPFLVD